MIEAEATAAGNVLASAKCRPLKLGLHLLSYALAGPPKQHVWHSAKRRA